MDAREKAILAKEIHVLPFLNRKKLSGRLEICVFLPVDLAREKNLKEFFYAI